MNPIRTHEQKNSNKKQTHTCEKQKEPHLKRTLSTTHTAVSSAGKFLSINAREKTHTHAKQNMNAIHTHEQKELKQNNQTHT